MEREFMEGACKESFKVGWTQTDNEVRNVAGQRGD